MSPQRLTEPEAAATGPVAAGGSPDVAVARARRSHSRRSGPEARARAAAPPLDRDHFRNLRLFSALPFALQRTYLRCVECGTTDPGAWHAHAGVGPSVGLERARH